MFPKTPKLKGRKTPMSNASAHPGFFTIYKPGQGKWLRWGTVASAALVAGSGAIWLYFFQGNVAALSSLGKVAIVALWVLVCAFLTFWFVNSPRYGEFLIMTESEMRKVTWPSRREVISSVKIVILLTCLLGLLLYLVDGGFIALFQWMGIA